MPRALSLQGQLRWLGAPLGSSPQIGPLPPNVTTPMPALWTEGWSQPRLLHCPCGFSIPTCIKSPLSISFLSLPPRGS